MKGISVALLCLVAILVLSISAGGQADNEPSKVVEVARKLYGDNRVIPKERIGGIRLGETTSQEFATHYGLTRLYGFRELTYYWNSPVSNFGRAKASYDQPFLFFFCQSNSRLFAVVSYGAGPWYRDAEIFWVFLRRLTTPEGLTTSHPPSRYSAVYGDRATILGDLDIHTHYQNPFRFQIFPNGLVIEPHHAGNYLRSIGVYNDGVCRGETLEGHYIEWVGWTSTKRVLASRTGDPEKGRIGDPIIAEPNKLLAISTRERGYFLLELSVTPPTKDIKVTITRKLFAEGKPYGEWPAERLFKAGEAIHTWVWMLGREPPRPVGKWRVEYWVRQTLITSIEFENTE